MIKSILGFINGTITVERQTVKTIYLSNGTHWRKHKFHQNRGLISGFIQHASDNNEIVKELNSIVVKKTLEKNILLNHNIQQLEKSIIDIKKAAESLSPKIKIGKSPINALRYIIVRIGLVDGNEKYRFLFAHEYASHSALEERAKKINPDEYVKSVGGGFYCLKDANALTYKEPSTLTFFGASDSFGMPANEIFEKALNNLKKDVPYIVKFERIPHERDWSLEKIK